MKVRVVITNDYLIEILQHVDSEELKIILETALIYYAKYLDENPTVKEAFLDIEKVSTEKVYEKSEDRHVVIREEALETLFRKVNNGYSISLNELDKLINVSKYSNKVRQVTYAPTNDYVKSILEYHRSLTISCSALMENALMFYINLLEKDPVIVDYRLNIPKLDSKGELELCK